MAGIEYTKTRAIPAGGVRNQPNLFGYVFARLPRGSAMNTLRSV